LDRVIVFERVSKKYRLGLTRTSLPTIVSNKLKNLYKSSGERNSDEAYIWALKDISFELKRGQSLALIGPNGAGKTTILRLLAKITTPNSGHIETNGRLSALIELGAGFHPDLTGRENIYLNGTILGFNRAEIGRRFDEIVDFSELERFIDTPVKRYSSGMSVRLGFSVAASIEPKILLVDEVLAVGDATFRSKCMARIKEMLANGTSTIFVSHNLWLAQAICDSAIYIDKGKIKYRGLTSDVIDAYDRDIHEKRIETLKISQPEEVSEEGNIEVTGLEIASPGGVTGNEFANDQPATVYVRYTAYGDIGPANLVIRIVRSDGLTCCMMRTQLDEYEFNIEQGNGVLSIELDPLQLYGGSYIIQAVFRDESDSWTLTSRWSEPFYVSGSPLSHQEMNGVFEPRRKWRHEKESTDFDGNDDQKRYSANRLSP